MADYRKDISTFTDYGAQSQDIERKRRMAELLQQQSMQPIETQTGVPISWTQGLAKLLQGYNAGQGMRTAAEEQKTLSAKRNQAMAAALGRMPGATQKEVAGSPEDAMQFNMAPQTESVQPTMQQDATWLGQLAQIGPDATQIGSSLLGMRQKETEADEARKFRAQESALARQARIDDLTVKLADARLTAQSRADLQRELATQKADLARELAESRNQNSLAIKELGRGMAGMQPVTPVTIQDPKNPNATIVIDGRTGRVFGSGPKLTDTGKLENKRQFNMQGIGSAIAEANRLLDSNPTESGLGSAVDTAAGFFGASPRGSVEARQLEAVGGAITSKVPRMEGPQSDADTRLYKQMSGMVGDRTVPVAQRKAALKAVEDLWAKYENMNPDAFASSGNSPSIPDLPPAGAVRRK